MKRYVSDGVNMYLEVTGENEDWFICNKRFFSKKDVIVSYHPLDDMMGKLHLHVVPFYQW